MTAREGSRFDPAAAVEALIDPDHPTKRKAAQWAEANLVDPELERRDVDCRFWDEGWRRLGEAGYLRMMIDPAWGGSGLDVFEALLSIEGLGYGCGDAGLLFALSTEVWTMLPVIEEVGTEEQKARYLPGLGRGELKAAFCITEADSGSDTFAMGTTHTVEEGPDGTPIHVLSGTKSYITLAPVADVFIVFATSDPALGQWGVTVFLVDRDTPGLTVGPNRPKMGLRTTPFSDVTLDGCRVGPEAVLGTVGAGASIFSNAMKSERAFVLAGQVGAMERQLDRAVAYSRERHQFGQPIGDFQAVSHRLADMKLRLDNARLQLYRAAILDAMGRPSMEAAALAKIQTSEAAVASALDAVLINGARGYVTEFGVEQDLRNVAGGVVYGGTSDVQRNIVARLLGRDAR
jgi:alkylation response protein AidB-like acyl-CoA dehydrogenase